MEYSGWWTLPLSRLTPHSIQSDGRELAQQLLAFRSSRPNTFQFLEGIQTTLRLSHSLSSRAILGSMDRAEEDDHCRAEEILDEEG